MLSCAELFKSLDNKGIGIFAGVPDSLLKDFCAFVTDNTSGERHIITANEGSAVALAAGHYLATQKIPLVYMQNSGLGNAVNPLSSLVAKEVYSIPMLLVIGWRGEPGIKDEPQHMKKGNMTPGMLEEMGIPFEVLPQELGELDSVLNKAFNYMTEHNAPFGLLVKKGTFEKYKLKTNKVTAGLDMTRESALKIAYESLDSKNSLFIGNTGMISRELYELKMNTTGKVEREFFNVGAMGHASQIALGVALGDSSKSVYCFDGDGAAIMHLGGFSTGGQLHLKNFKHIILNNGAHDSVGGQPTDGHSIDFGKIALASNYRRTFIVKTEAELRRILPEFAKADGPVLLDVWVNKGARDDLGRPKTTPIENKIAFMENF